MHEVYTVSHLLGALPRSAQTGNPRVVHELGLALQHSKPQPTMAMNTCFLIHGTVGHLGPLWFRAAPRVSFWDSGSLGHALLADSERSDDDRPGHTCTSAPAACIGRSKSQGQAPCQWVGNTLCLLQSRMTNGLSDPLGPHPITVTYTALPEKLLSWTVGQHLKTDAFTVKT